MKKEHKFHFLLIVGAMLCLASALFIIVSEVKENRSYENSKNMLLYDGRRIEDTDSSSYRKGTPTPTGEITDHIYQKQEFIFPTTDTLKENNITGWVYIDGIVSEPIMQAEDNAYYLSHSYDGTDSRYGSAFLDCRCMLSDSFLLIYGHNVRGGQVFGSLKLLRDEERSRLADARMCFAPDYEIKDYKICIVAIVQETNDIFALSSIPAQLEANALFIVSEIDSEKQTVLLSTCYGNAGTDKRIVIALQEDK